MKVQVGNSACRTAALLMLTLGASLLTGCFFVDDDRTGGACDAIVTDCYEVCDTYCDPWGCWDECFTECEDTCVQYDYAPVTVIDDRACFADRECRLATAARTTSACRRRRPGGPPVRALPGALGLPRGWRALHPARGRRERRRVRQRLPGGRDCPAGYECVSASNTQQCVPVDRVCDGRAPVAECDRDAECGEGQACEAGCAWRSPPRVRDGP